MWRAASKFINIVNGHSGGRICIIQNKKLWQRRVNILDGEQLIVN